VFLYVINVRCFSEDNFVLLVLDPVIDFSGPLVVCVVNKTSHVSCSFQWVELQFESLLQVLKTSRLEARITTIEHKFNEDHQLLCVFSDGQETLHHSFDEKLVWFRFRISTQNIDEFLGELEISRFKAHIFARTPVKDETEVNVNQVTLLVNHDIPVVSVFYLQNI